MYPVAAKIWASYYVLEAFPSIYVVLFSSQKLKKGYHYSYFIDGETGTEPAQDLTILQLVILNC